MLQLPRVGWRLLACLNGASPDCIVVVVALDAVLQRECLCQQTLSMKLCRSPRALEGSENWRSTPGQPGGARKTRTTAPSPYTPP